MILNAFTHYQTSFKVVSQNESYSPLFGIQNILNGWLHGKEPDRILRHNKDFFRKCSWENLYKTRSSIATNTAYIEEGHKIWAMRYTHPDAELGKGLFWYVDVGLREKDSIVTFFVRVSFAQSKYDLRDFLDLPTVSTPRFIKEILNAKSGLSAFSGSREFALLAAPVPIKIGYGKDLADWIQSPKRRYPLIVFNGDALPMAKEAVKIASLLAGKAQVLVIQNDRELAEEISLFLPKDLRILYGKLRVFYPLNPNFSRPERHRWFDINDPDYETNRSAIVSSLLRNYTLEEPGAVTNISEVGRSITLARLRESALQAGIQQNELTQFYDILKEVETERDEYKAEAARWVVELEQREEEVTNLKAQLHSLHRAQPGPEIPAYDAAKQLHKLPKSLLDVVEIKARMHADRLIFADQARDSAAAYTSCESIDKAWEILGHLATTLYELKFESNASIDIADEFYRRTSFEYAKTEGPNTKNNKALCQTRQITVNNRRYEIWPHIRHGNREPKMLRIHFAFDDDLKKIIVGFVGSHMPNATSRKVG